MINHYFPHWPHPGQKIPAKTNLSHLHAALALIGNPHQQLPPIIHVAGTNGKGSTIAFMRSILEEAGLKVHVYTSPHLIKFTERIRLAGNEITTDYLYNVIERVRIAVENTDINLRFFEGITLAAYLAFAEVKADILLLETGMGGRLDATNVVAKPVCTVITTISFDHQQYLGDSIAKIAMEKAGIIKEQVPCVSALQYKDAYNVIEAVARHNNSSLHAFEYDWYIKQENSLVTYQTQDFNIDISKNGLVGVHQIINAGTAITALLQLKHISVTKENIKFGIANTKWPGRLQKLTRGLYHYSHLSIYVDGAHNEAGALAAANWLNTQSGPKYLVIGITKGRNIKQFLQPFVNVSNNIFAVEVENEPLSYKAEVIVQAGNDIGMLITACNNVDDALNYIAHTEQRQSTVLVCGSLFLAGEVLYKNKAIS